MGGYISLGLGTNKYNQIFLLVFSFFMSGANYFIGSSDAFWLVLLIMTIVINLLYYPFNDIKYNTEAFIIEKLFSKKEVSSKKFISVEKRLFNIFIIKFTEGKFYYLGDFKSLFEDTSSINERVKSAIK
jgi:hypothetical protein